MGDGLEFDQIAAYLGIALMVYYIIMAITGDKNNNVQKWASIIFIGVMVLLIAYLYWDTYYAKDTAPKEVEEEEYNDDLSDTSNISEEKEVYQPLGREYVDQHKEFAIVDEPTLYKQQFTLETFRSWYLTPEFLTKYTEAVRESYYIKSKKLMDVRRKFMENLKAVGKQKSSGQISDILNSLDRTDDSKMIEMTISQVESLLLEIKTKLKDLSIETVKRNLFSALNDKENGLSSLAGRDDIKNYLALQLYTFAQNPRVFLNNFQNMAIYGPSGVGKTKLAQVIGHVYASSGILVRNHVHVITKQSITTAYVNESAKMTRKLLLSNLESVVFIDEAYDMTPPPSLSGNGLDHGYEAITEIVNFIDKMKGLSIIMVAGYEDEMERRFMKANQGLPRRFPHKLILQPYQAKELTDIAMNFIRQTCPEIKFQENASDYLYTTIKYINVHCPEALMYQGGDMENLSGCICRAIYGTPGKTWDQDDEEIILSGVNAFLAIKGVTLEELT